MEVEQKPCWAEECGAQSRVNFATCPWSGACGLFGQQISLAPAPTAPLSTAHTISLTARTHTVSPGSHYKEENVLNLRRYLLNCVKRCFTFTRLKNVPGWVLPDAPSGQPQSSVVSLWQGGQADSWHHLSTVVLAKGQISGGLEKGQLPSSVQSFWFKRLT